MSHGRHSAHLLQTQGSSRSQGGLLLLCSSQGVLMYFAALPVPPPSWPPLTLYLLFPSLVPPPAQISHPWYQWHSSCIIIWWERRTVLCIIGCLAAYLASTHQRPIAHPIVIKNVSRLCKCPLEGKITLLKATGLSKSGHFGLVRESVFRNSFLRGRSVLYSD